MVTEAAQRSDLPPCGGEARQGRGGCQLHVLPIMPGAAPELSPSVTFGDISLKGGETIGRRP
jgi:hypothetical protein